MLTYVATIRRLVFFFLLSLLAGCGAEEANGPAKEAPEKEETPPVPVALRLVAEGEFLVGETIQLHPSLIMDDGSEIPVSEGVVYESSNEEVATVDPSGLVQVVAGGEVTIRAIATHDLAVEPLEAEIGGVATCTYPEFDTSLGQGNTVPPFAWNAMTQDGEPIFFSFADLHCNAEWKWVKTVHLVLSAGWCTSCTGHKRTLSMKRETLRSLGMLVVIVELDTMNNREPADTAFAYDHVRSTTQNVPGIVAGDLDTFLGESPAPNYFRQSGYVGFYPTKAVIRTRDMRMIADGSENGPWAGRDMPLEQMARFPDIDWHPL